VLILRALPKARNNLTVLRQLFAILTTDGSKDILKVFIRETADTEAHAYLETSISAIIVSVNSRCRI
jgi:hypothetical protein